MNHGRATAVLDTRLDANNGLHSGFMQTMRAEAEVSPLTEETTMTRTLIAAAGGSRIPRHRVVIFVDAFPAPTSGLEDLVLLIFA